ncbi:MAG: hypothetical protein M3373_12155 [Gemmatimonadota bacterium]|nr:hypothetical protein [Gemmatimonadota bacterium]
MRTLSMLGAALLLAGCASGGGGRVPESGDPAPLIMSAERQIELAQQAGAEALSAETLGAARQSIANAKAQLQIGERGRAALHARQALADAIYAQELAKRAAAERARTEAQAAVQALPPEGGAR